METATATEVAARRPVHERESVAHGRAGLPDRLAKKGHGEADRGRPPPDSVRL
jgi:hypothetical protein